MPVALIDVGPGHARCCAVRRAGGADRPSRTAIPDAFGSLPALRVVTFDGRRGGEQMFKIRRAIVAAVAAVGLAVGTMGAAAAASTFYHHKTTVVAGADTFYHH